jgi:hypothetical protein
LLLLLLLLPVAESTGGGTSASSVDTKLLLDASQFQKLSCLSRTASAAA